MDRKISDWDRMIRGKLYNAGSKDIFKNHRLGMIRCETFNKIPLVLYPLKQFALERLIPSAKKKNFTVFAPFYCEYGVNIRVGKDCFCNYGCTFLDIAPVTLEDGVWLGANVTLATPMHPFLSDERMFREYPDGLHDLEYSKPITIRKNCWICSGVTVCGGVTIGENCVIAAGAVVTRDMPANTLCAGVPARVIRELDENDRIDVWETYVKNETPLSRRDKMR